MQINHSYSHLHILPVEQAIATLNQYNEDMLLTIEVIVKPMHKKPFLIIHDLMEEKGAVRFREATYKTPGSFRFE